MTRLPKTIGTTADHMYRVRAERLAAHKKCQALEAQERRLADHFEVLARDQRLSKASGSVSTVSVKYEPMPVIEDMTQVVEWGAKHEASDIFFRRLNAKACRDRADDGQAIAGVSWATVRKISISKRGT